jgi:hypothetical protein
VAAGSTGWRFLPILSVLVVVVFPLRFDLRVVILGILPAFSSFLRLFPTVLASTWTRLAIYSLTTAAIRYPGGTQ